MATAKVGENWPEQFGGHDDGACTQARPSNLLSVIGGSGAPGVLRGQYRQAHAIPMVLGAPDRVSTLGDFKETDMKLSENTELMQENARLRAALLRAIPWIGANRDGPSWATPEAKAKSIAMCDQAFEEATSFFPHGSEGETVTA